MHKYLKLLQKDSSIDEENMKTEVNYWWIKDISESRGIIFTLLLFIIITAYKLIIM